MKDQNCSFSARRSHWLAAACSAPASAPDEENHISSKQPKCWNTDLTIRQTEIKMMWTDLNVFPLDKLCDPYQRNTLNHKCIHNLGNFYKLLNQPHEYGIPAGSWMSYWPGASAESQTPGSWPGQTHWSGSLQGQGWLGISELENVPFADGIHQHLDGNINAEHRYLKLFTLGTLKETQKT